MGEYWNLERLTQEWEARGLSRRDLMKLVGAGAGGAAIATLMKSDVAAQDGGAQVRMLWRAPVTLNPLYSTAGFEQQVERNIFGTLVKMSDALSPTPDLCESIEGNVEGTQYTFTLREGLTFNDGTPLTSADVIFTLERAINPATGSIWKGRLSGVAGAADYDGSSGEVEGLVAVDDRTVQINLAAPDSVFLVNICSFTGLGILPKHVLGEVPPDQLREHEFSLNPTVSAGPFDFVQFATDQYLELKSSETGNYTTGVDQIFLPILTPEVGLGQLETGEIDLMTVPVAEVERVSGLEGVTVVTVPSPSMDFLAVNLNREFLQNVDIRKAMMHAIDREGIVNAVLRGEGTVVNSSIFGPEWMGVPEGLEPYAYDPELAKSLLEGSGFDTSQPISIMHLPGTASKDAAIAIIQEQLSQVGFNVEILQVDVAELNRRYIEENDFDLFYNAGGVFRADPSISSNYFYTANFTPSGGNGSHYTNPRVDELFDQGKGQTDLEERQATYTEIAQILNAELPWIFLWSPNSIYGFRDRLQGFAPPSYVDNQMWNADEWTVSE
ncbi:MAG: ABC transporter substrate-binding protein [Thermomicrobiales bacterium]|nr:ABC transporter substrate-binding protein [Thermomicrobiales bacterium]